MKKERKLFDAITDLPDNMVEEAGENKEAGEKKAAGFQGKKTGRRRAVWASLAACAVLALGAAGIGIGRNGSLGGAGTEAVMKVTFPKAYAYDDSDTRWEIRDANPVEESFLDAVKAFSYQTTSEFFSGEKENENYSPLSLYYALSLAASGAEGETAQELLALLGAKNQEQLSLQCGNLYRCLYADNTIGKFKIANSLWLDRRASFKDAYVKNAAENFYAPAYHVDAADESTKAAMEKWVAENTNGTIRPDIRLDGNWIMSILNTIYYKNEWVDRFDESKTEKGTFYLADGGTVECDYMNRTYGSASFGRGDNYTKSSLGLKYFGSMVFILPDEGVSVQELLDSPEKVQEIFESENNGYGEVVWQVPKFDFGAEYNLADSMKALGIQAAFDGEKADFSRMTDEMAFISAIRQETHISVDEKGVEASAFTQIAYAGAGMPQSRADMILDRPFIYGIVTNEGLPVFIGVCGNPAQS